jgi:hypothetical protein
MHLSPRSYTFPHMRAFTFTLLALAAIPALSQTAQSNIINALLEETTIQSGTAGQFEPAHKDYCAAVVKGGAPACLVFSTATFGQSGLYFTLLPFASFAHYDQGKYTDKGLTPDEAKALNARRLPPIASNHESAVALHRDVSILAPPTITNAELPLNFFTEYLIRPGADNLKEFLDAIGRYMLSAARKSGVAAFEVFTTTVGGSPERVLIVTRLKNFAQLDQPDPIQASMSGFQGRDFESMIVRYVEHRETYIMRYRADLSADPRH